MNGCQTVKSRENRCVWNLSLRIDDSKAEGETELILNFDEPEDAAFSLTP
jgi:hypothetical protein